ncbi:fimbrillin family protein [Thioalkalivibrio sp. ALJ2]|uniref:fimbrillin family protein n=1 Tax=Thioalkalivibrio sp. ALJ2 TaxID=1261622 RepID=UPI0003753E3A|nr:fimbrillin family protein [Thioalkalivibrio sp. ALJ2]
MYRHARITGFLVLSVAATLVLAGCGGEEEEANPPQGLEQQMAPQDMSSDDARRPTNPGLPAADVKKSDD